MKLGSFDVTRRAATGPRQDPDFFEFCGHPIRITEDDPSALPFLELADALENGIESDDQQGMAAMYRMLKGCIHADDWPTFRKIAMEHNASPQDLMPIVGTVWEAVSGRPTQRPADSPDGPSTISTSSKAGSSSPVTARPSPDDTLIGPSAPAVVDSPPSVAPASAAMVVALPPGWPPPPPERMDVLRPQVLVDQMTG